MVNELRGEKIDVVQWIDDPARFVANALAPAKVKEVHIDEATGTAQVIVPDYQLSLAIGKEGQNARLAAKLTGYRIDIKSETQAIDEQRTDRTEPAAVADEPEQPPEVEVAAPGDGSVPPAAMEEPGPSEAVLAESPDGDGDGAKENAEAGQEASASA